VLRHLLAVFAGAGPVAVGYLRNNLSPFFQRLQYYRYVKFLTQRVFHTDLNIVKVDEDRELKPLFGHKLPPGVPPYRGTLSS